MATTTTHRARQDAVVVATTDLLASHSFQEVLSVEEERGLSVLLKSGALRRFLTDLGIVSKPVGEWEAEEMMRVLAVAVRAAVPLRTLPDHEAFRLLNDEVPF